LSAGPYRWGQEDNPFLAWRSLLFSHHLALAQGLSDADYQEIVQELDERVAGVEGHGFRRTSFEPHKVLSSAHGVQLWIKDETGQVGGSHKARHLMGLALYLEVVERLSWFKQAPQLAIASCGNAAQAAAVVAAAVERPLRVFIPPEAEPHIVQNLERLEAQINFSPRRQGESGDPCFLRFQEALLEGALPFCCQGSENGLTLEGGATLAWEMGARLAEAGESLDQLIIQVGGGALGSATIRGLRELHSLGLLEHLPQIHTVQPEGTAPLARAYRLLRAGFEDRGEALSYAAAHRAEFMWPWEDGLESIARGIVDDETYDWRCLIDGMWESGGEALTVSEEDLLEAREQLQAQGIPASATGGAGLAALLQMRREGRIQAGARVAILVTG